MDLDNFKIYMERGGNKTNPKFLWKTEKRIHMPLDKIRKNMRIEFWYTIPMILIFIVSAFYQ